MIGNNKWVYIGKGVHVCYDGDHVVLKTKNNKIFLDPHVIRAFKGWHKCMFAQQEEDNNG